VIAILPRKSIQENGDHGYLMMNGTVLGFRSNCGAQAWRSQATGAVLPRGSLSTLRKGQILSAEAAVARGDRSKLSRQSRAADRP
jgi:hypothetical protein